MPADLATLPNLPDQAERLIELGVQRIAGLTADRVRAAVRRPVAAGALLVVHHNVAPASTLTPLLSHAGRTPLTLTEAVHWLLQRPDCSSEGVAS